MQQFIDNWSASLLAPATASAVSLSVEPAKAALLTGLGTGDFYRLTLVEVDAAGTEIDWDVVQVTAVAAGMLTVTRTGTARSWAEGALIEARLTAAGMGELRDAGGVDLGDAAPLALGSASAGTSALASREDHQHPAPTPGDIGAATSAQGALADTAVQPADLATVATSGAYADLSGKPFIPSTPGDIGAATAGQGDKADTAVQPAALTAALADKVDKEAGKGLSSNDFTSADKTKLDGVASGAVALSQVVTYAGTAKTLALTDNNTIIDCTSSSAVTITIPPQSSVAWTADAEIHVRMSGTGPVSIAVGAGVTVPPLTVPVALAGQGAMVTLKRRSSDVWAVVGLSNVESVVRGTVLTGLSTADSTPVVATDTVLIGFGKLQAQMGGVASALDAINGEVI